MKERRCKDCDPDTKRPRPAPHQGPRCTTHHREFRKRARQVKHEGHVTRTYGLGPGDYGALEAYQREQIRAEYPEATGVCWICGPWSGRNGATKRLPVDHDHQTEEVRGLLCTDCNRMLGHARDRPEMFQRAMLYLINPPARGVLPGRQAGMID